MHLLRWEMAGKDIAKGWAMRHRLFTLLQLIEQGATGRVCDRKYQPWHWVMSK